MATFYHPSTIKQRLLCSAVLIALLLGGCSLAKSNSSPSSVQTAAADLVQTLDAEATKSALMPTAQSAPPAPGEAGEAYNRTITFSGQKWWVKSSSQPVGPGPNLFSDLPGSAWVDQDGMLHLKIVHMGDKWYSAEVVSQDALGNGSYQFRIESGEAGLDPNAVLGLFTWDTGAANYHYREIDIELSRWAEATDLNAQFVVQPFDNDGNRHRFAIDPQVDSSTQIFTWHPMGVQFLSFKGLVLEPASADVVEQWTYTGADTPPAGGATNARINLWLNNGQPPTDGKEIEVVLASFAFIPEEVSK